VKKAWIWIVIGILICIGVGGAIMYSQIEEGMASLLTRQIDPLDFSEVPNGTYRGEFSAIPISVVVDVTVINGSVTDIDIVRHDNGQGAAGEGVVEEVLETQSLTVDAIAGATYSSKCILLAIEDALKEQNPAE
jgi:uncharacterized protein with FMN-binding domain